MHKKEEDQSKQLLRFVNSAIWGGVMALALCLAFLFLCSIGIANGWLKENLIFQYALAGCLLGSLLGGFFAVKRCGSRTLLVGLCVGIILFLLLLLAGMLAYTGASVEKNGLGLCCACLGGGILAGLMGGKKKKKRKK